MKKETVLLFSTLAWKVLPILAVMAMGTFPVTGPGSALAEPESLSVYPDVVTPDCVDFESLTPAAQYSVGDSFVDSGAVVRAEPFVFSDGTVFSGGHAQIGNSGLAGGSGLEVNLNNINLGFDFGDVLSGLIFRFGEYGGNLNIEVNGDFRNFTNFADINATNIGGVSVLVLNGLGNDMGGVRLSGEIVSFAIGGQELWIDDLCPETDCVDFEDQIPASTYNVGDTFVDSGVLITGRTFFFNDGTPFSNGVAQVGFSGLAGGSGLEVNLNNINLEFNFGRPLRGLSVHFGEYGGNLNIEVNGDFRNFSNFADLNGLMVGGARVVVNNGLGNDIGRLYLFGEIQSFILGGQELWIDNVCPDTCCIDFEGLPPGAAYNVGNSFSESCALVTVMPFVWSDGTIFDGGVAQVGSSELAGGNGQELQANNVNISFDLGLPVKELTMLFGEYGGNLNLEINGVFQNFNNFADLDGTTIGGVQVAVVNGLGNDKGRLSLNGLIQTLAVGGQELWIDDICFEEVEQLYLPVITHNLPAGGVQVIGP